MSPEVVRANYERIRGEVGGGVTIVAATKYVAPADLGVLAEAGIEVVGENRAQDLERKHSEYGDAFRWHFIGHLQSNKVKVVNRICELVHSLDSESACLPPRAIPSRRVPTSGASVSSPKNTAWPSCPWGRARTTRSLRRRERPSSAWAQSCTGSNISREMGFADVWNKTLVYFGIAEEEDWDEDAYVTDEDLQRSYAERPNVRRLAPRRREREFDDWTDPEPTNDRTAVLRPRVAAVPSPASVRVHLVVPRSFNDAQQIADKFKESIPVILNLQSSEQDLSKRLIDFASGLTYALDGGMQRVADKVFLLTPRNVEVSAEERARLLERGGFFNQA